MMHSEYFWNAFFKILQKAPVGFLKHVIDSLLPHSPALLKVLQTRFLPIPDPNGRHRGRLSAFHGGISIFKSSGRDIIFDHCDHWVAYRWKRQKNATNSLANIKAIFEIEAFRTPGFLQKLQVVLSAEFNAFASDAGATRYNAISQAETIMTRDGPVVAAHVARHPVCIYILFKRFAQTLFDAMPPPSLTKNFRTIEVVRLLKKCNEQVDCVVCMDVVPYDNLYVLSCGHQFCEGCVGKIKQPRRCPCCRVPFKIEMQ